MCLKNCEMSFPGIERKQDRQIPRGTLANVPRPEANEHAQL